VPRTICIESQDNATSAAGTNMVNCKEGRHSELPRLGRPHDYVPHPLTRLPRAFVSPESVRRQLCWSQPASTPSARSPGEATRLATIQAASRSSKWVAINDPFSGSSAHISDTRMSLPSHASLGGRRGQAFRASSSPAGNRDRPAEDRLAVDAGQAVQLPLTKWAWAGVGGGSDDDRASRRASRRSHARASG
jgi:hypothetical protein